MPFAKWKQHALIQSQLLAVMKLPQMALDCKRFAARSIRLLFAQFLR
jgi:hypothetical protein